MKKNISIFLLGIFASICIGAGISNSELLIVKPATPKSTVVKQFRSMFFLENEVSDFIRSKVKEGYILKSSMIWDDEDWSKGVVVMEKY